MADLCVGVATILITSTGLFVMGIRWGRQLPRHAVLSAIVAVIGFMLFFGLVLLDGPPMARLLPFSNVIVLGNWLAPAAALLAGLAWPQMRGPAWRRAVVVLALCVVGSYKLAAPVLGRTPRMRDYWAGSVCLQTSESSCSAAAAATILRAHGIPATEQEMAELCLTRAAGTTFHGLYRGLVLKTRGTPWQVEVIDTSDRMPSRLPAPAILNVWLDHAHSDSRYAQEWGWTPGVPHTVLFFGPLPDDKVDMGDPSVGREAWTTEGLRVLWHGTGLHLVRR